MEIGLDWISIDVDVEFVESNDKMILEVVSGDFKGTKLYVTLTEITDPNSILYE